ncbi:hypothetical protein V6N13_107479 [Hibiscus sabdariffa]
MFRIAYRIEELELNMEFGVSMDGITVLVQDIDLSVGCVSVDDVFDGNVSSSDERCTDGAVGFDGEDDVGDQVSAVDVETLQLVVAPT